MLDSIRRLRSQVRRFENRDKPTGTRYSAAFRAEVVTHAHAEVRAGVPIMRIARALGLRPKTLTLWMRRMPASAFRAVRVEGDPRPNPTSGPAVVDRLVVVAPSGIRIEGLDIAGVIQVMRSLS